jgi:cysteinyl-tRNA synthetase
VINLSAYAKNQDPSFLVIGENAHKMITLDGRAASMPDFTYLDALNGLGRDKLIYGYYNVDQESPFDVQSDWAFFLTIARINGYPVFVTDYCTTPVKIDTAHARNTRNDFISFAAEDYTLDAIPAYPVTPYNENNQFISKLDSAKNFLYLTEGNLFGSKAEFITAIQNTNYDLLITSLYTGGWQLTPTDLELLKQKNNGGLRLVFACASIGQAEKNRYYWNNDWLSDPPLWLKEEDPENPGNYYVAYWEAQWQAIIFGSAGSYAKKIIDAGFDGICLTQLEVYEHFIQNGK